MSKRLPVSCQSVRRGPRPSTPKAAARWNGAPILTAHRSSSLCAQARSGRAMQQPPQNRHAQRRTGVGGCPHTRAHQLHASCAEVHLLMKSFYHAELSVARIPRGSLIASCRARNCSGDTSVTNAASRSRITEGQRSGSRQSQTANLRVLCTPSFARGAEAARVSDVPRDRQ